MLREAILITNRIRMSNAAEPAAISLAAATVRPGMEPAPCVFTYQRWMVRVSLAMDGSNVIELPGLETPMVKTRAAVSPITFPAERISPVTRAGRAEGKTTVRIMCHLLEPRARLASRN